MDSLPWTGKEFLQRGMLKSCDSTEESGLMGSTENGKVIPGRDSISQECSAVLASLKDCTKRKDLCTGTRLHAEVLKKGLLERSHFVASAIVSMYAKCGALTKAQRVLEELPVRSVVSWNALIAGCVQHGCGTEAFSFFEQMHCEGFYPNAVTFTCILKACGNVRALDKGKQIHDEVVRQGLLGTHAALSTALVDMYAKCGALEKARQVVDQLPVRTVINWSALIAGYAQHGHGEEALNCFEQMQSEGLCPDVITLTCILKACGSVGAADKGEQIHDEIVRQGLLGKNIALGNALVDMYAKCGVLAKAAQVLNELPVRSVLAWTALIAGYTEQGHGEEALNCFERMEREGVYPDAVTFACILKACGSVGAADKGKQIHDEIVRQGLLGTDIVLGNAVVDMYVKCGALAKAQEVLHELPIRNVATWSSLIAGYAQKGHSEKALNCFEQMQHEGLSPDAITFVSVLNACSHSCLLEKGQMYFASMSSNYGISPSVEHHTCMVELFGRTGHFDKVIAMIKKLPSFEHLHVWTALLSTCRKWGNVKLGRLAFEHALQLDKCDAGDYAALTNISAAADMQEKADKVKL